MKSSILSSFTPYQQLEAELAFSREYYEYATNTKSITVERGRSWVCFYQKDNRTNNLQQLDDILQRLYNDSRYLLMGTEHHRFTREAYQTFHQMKQDYPHQTLKLEKASPNWVAYLAYAVDPKCSLLNGRISKIAGFIRKIFTRGIHSPHEQPAIMIQCEVGYEHLHDLWTFIANAMDLEFVGLYSIPRRSIFINTDVNRTYFDATYLIRANWIHCESNVGMNIANTNELVRYLAAVHQIYQIEHPHNILFESIHSSCGNLIRLAKVDQLFKETEILKKFKNAYSLENLKIIKYRHLSNNEVR